MPTAESLTRQIQQASDIVDVVSRHVRVKRAGKDFRGLCPFHKEKTPSFYVVPAKQIFKCFGCGVGGDVFKFLQLHDGVGFAEARRMLADQAGIRLDSHEPGRGKQGPDRGELARVNDWAARWFARQLTASAAGKSALNYAVKRGFSDETLGQFGVGCAPDQWDALLGAAQKAGIALPLLLAA
ncbi:MAG: CHC2 zinc finger domain-containing protein, partial [Phycisphaerae bacterium]